MNLGDYLRNYRERDWETAVDTEGGPVRIAVVGLGGFARERALPAIASADYCAVGAVVSGSPEKAASVGATFDAERVLTYEEFRSGEGTDAYDAAYIATPNATHFDFAAAAADWGKAVMVEKPIEATVDRAERLIEACDAADVTLMVAYRAQLAPAIRRFREVFRDGFVGDPVHLRGGFSVPLLAETDADPDPNRWRLDPDLAGGGALFDLGVYPLNTARFLLDADPIRVAAITSSDRKAFADVEEHVSFHVEFEGGVVGSFTASFGTQRESRLSMTGTEGRLVLDSAFGADVGRDNVVERGDINVEVTGPEVDEVREEFDHFGHAVLTGRTPDPDGADGLVDLRTMVAAYEAAANDTWVDPS